MAPRAIHPIVKPSAASLFSLLAIVLSVAVGLLLFGRASTQIVTAAYVMFALASAVVTFGFLGSTAAIKTQAQQLGGSGAMFVIVLIILLRMIRPDERADVVGTVYRDGLPIDRATVYLLETDSADVIREVQSFN